MGRQLSPEPESWISPLDRDTINLGFIFIPFSALLLVPPTGQTQPEVRRQERSKEMSLPEYRKGGRVKSGSGGTNIRYPLSYVFTLTKDKLTRTDFPLNP